MIHHTAVMTDRRAQIRHRVVRPTRRRWLVKVSASQVWLFGRRIGAFKSFLQVSRCDSWVVELCVWGSRWQTILLSCGPSRTWHLYGWKRLNGSETPPPPPTSFRLAFSCCRWPSVFCCGDDRGCHQRRQMKAGLYPHLCPSLLTTLPLSPPPPVISHPSPCVNNEQRQPPVFTIKEKLTTRRTEKFNIAYAYFGIYKKKFPTLYWLWNNDRGMHICS